MQADARARNVGQFNNLCSIDFGLEVTLTLTFQLIIQFLTLQKLMPAPFEQRTRLPGPNSVSASTWGNQPRREPVKISLGKTNDFQLRRAFQPDRCGLI
jgi:hypothetical protein